MKITIRLAASALLITASPALAQGSPPASGSRGQGAMMMMMMSRIDLNSDGFISAVEHRQWSEKVFTTMDGNKDGKLSRDEFLTTHMGPGPRGGGNEARMQAMRQQADARKTEEFSAMSKNDKGLVSRAQFLTHSERKFVSGDTNKDGKLSATEFRHGGR